MHDAKLTAGRLKVEQAKDEAEVMRRLWNPEIRARITRLHQLMRKTG